MKSASKNTLNNLVEDHITAVVRDSITMQRNTKRPRRTLDSSSVKLAIHCLQKTSHTTSVTNTPIVSNTNKKIDLNALLASEIPIPPPTEIGMTLHWLAVDGTQPISSLNPQQVQVDAQQVQTNQENDRNSNTSSSVALRRLLPRLVSDELQLYFTRITHAITSNPDAAVTRLAQDPGIQELIPFFVQYITKTVHQNIQKTEKCRVMIHCIDALIRNRNVHLELFLDQILPCVLTCIVATRIGSSGENHWSLRDEASDVLGRICALFGDKYGNLRGKVIQILCKALDGTQLGRCYGAIVAITIFGPSAVDAFILPLVGYWRVWEEALQTATKEDRFDLQRCQDAFLHAMAVFVGNVSDAEQSNRMEYEHLFEVFGNALVPLFSKPNSKSLYVECFI